MNVKYLVAVVTLAASLFFGGIVVNAQAPASVQTFQSGSGETKYDIPATGTPYCFTASPDLPAGFPACPNVNWNGAVAPDSKIGPVITCPVGEVAITVAPWCAKLAG